MERLSRLAIRVVGTALGATLVVGFAAGPCLAGTASPAATTSRIPAASAPLDLTSLEKRLRQSKAIGVFTKLALKNQVDDLLDQFRAFHDGKGDATIAELRESYDLLLLKVLSLLQDKDAKLARDLVASREAIWSVLVDPAKFSTLQ
jgi:hypothetical protein